MTKPRLIFCNVYLHLNNKPEKAYSSIQGTSNKLAVPNWNTNSVKVLDYRLMRNSNFREEKRQDIFQNKIFLCNALLESLNPQT
jgi:hypothetical protein